MEKFFRKLMKPKKKKSVRNEEIELEVDRETSKPSEAWARLSEFNPSVQLPTDFFLNQPRQPDRLRFVCISDTHGVVEHDRWMYHRRIPDGDVLIHCGDFTMGGDPFEITSFDSFICKCILFLLKCYSIFICFYITNKNGIYINNNK